MKKILTLLSLMAATTFVYGQGDILFADSSTTFAIFTNTALSFYDGGVYNGPNGVGGGTTGKAGSATANSYFYTLLISSATQTTNNPLAAGWSQAFYSNSLTLGSPMLATNFPNAGFSGQFFGPNNNQSTVITNWPAATVDSFVLVGWSASLGNNWLTVSNELSSGNWQANGYFGVSQVGNLASGGGGNNPAATLFGAGGITSTTDLYAITTTPEPATIALAGLGGLSVLLFRRRKA